MPGHILIVDDERDIRQLLREMLTLEGHEVAEATNGAEALSRLRDASFDLVLTDVRMPNLSGMELLRRVREVSPSTEVVVATAYAELDTAIECMRAGAFDLLRKPFNLQELFSCVSRALEKRRFNVSTDLVRLSQALFEQNAIEQLPRAIVDSVRSFMAADAALLALPDTDGKLQVAHAQGLLGEEESALCLSLGERMVRMLSRDQMPAVLGPLGGDWRFKDFQTLPRELSVCVLPLAARERMLGVLVVLRRSEMRALNRGELDRASLLASHAVLALENARMAGQLSASERMASMGLVAAGISHEINNPASFVLSNLLYIQKGLNLLSRTLHHEPHAKEPREPLSWGPREQEEFEAIQEAASEAYEGTRRICEIIRDMRALSRMDDATAGWFDLNEAIRSALRITRAETTPAAMVVVELSDGIQVKGTPGRVSQVFSNLIINAAQALSDWKGPRREIRVTSLRAGDRAIVEVADTGPGIAPEHLSRVFQPFFTTKGMTTGTGLGLSISRDIVRRLGGDIEVQSEQGVGTVFTVSLPARPTEGS
ncbi:response regulator [Hyalangium minutum]|uniref:histidine kinase n=1 Tax=Hyalangium minutum TaxID=394096 RepID=A0A085WJY8_9BACT|nr:response regulator [Hyalangium minutum]KFE68001.1 Alkaline phosphatase synthesis transcriptional regulatory protein PhoP [Hyalangium minutum]